MGFELVFGLWFFVSFFFEDVWDCIVGVLGVCLNCFGQVFYNVFFVMCIVVDVVGVI